MIKDQLESQIEGKKPICSHIKKLSKKQVLSILQNPAQIKCETHKFHVQDETICLHCNKVFCGLNSIQKCIGTHQTLNNDHVFSLNCKNETIFCSQCGQTIDYFLKIYANENQNQDLKKLKRFGQFIHETYKQLKKQIQESKKLQMQTKYRGLQNMGNTCFLNTVLQVLNYSKKLVQLYREYKFSSGLSKSISSINKSIGKEIQYFYDQVIEQGESKVWHVVTKKNQSKNRQTNQKLIKTITNCKFNELFKNFIQEMSKVEQNNQPYQPVMILDFLSHIDKKYSLEQEQDAEQALLFIMDILVQGELVSMGYDMERYAHVEKFIGRQKISPTQRIFGFYLLSQIYCQNCKKINYTLDLTYHLSINIPTISNNKNLITQSISKHLSQKIEMKQKLYHKQLKYPILNNKNQQQQSDLVLPQFLSEFFHQQRLTQRQNYYKCSNCSSLVGLKKFYLVDLPEIIIISVKRFDHKMIKNSKHVQFQQVIDLKDVALVPINEDNQEERINTKYILYGVIVHLGDTIHNGHYVCFVKTSSNIWLRCSDHNVKKVTWNEVKQQQAYVLLYEKIKE